VTTTLAPPPAPTRPSMTAREASELRDQLRSEGWRPLENSLDWRPTQIGREQAGRHRTIVWINAFAHVLGGARAWWTEGIVPAPEASDMTEIYEVVAGEHTAGRWRPV
jgi:hypothetical protein